MIESAADENAADRIPLHDRRRPADGRGCGTGRCARTGRDNATAGSSGRRPGRDAGRKRVSVRDTRESGVDGRPDERFLRPDVLPGPGSDQRTAIRLNDLRWQRRTKCRPPDRPNRNRVAAAGDCRSADRLHARADNGGDSGAEANRSSRPRTLPGAWRCDGGRTRGGNILTVRPALRPARSSRSELCHPRCHGHQGRRSPPVVPWFGWRRPPRPEDARAGRRA